MVKNDLKADKKEKVKLSCSEKISHYWYKYVCKRARTDRYEVTS